jgi:hydroxypyruvate reductase
VPAKGLDIGFVAEVNRALLDSGANITGINLVRSHLSRIKGGGLGPIPTYVLSDVAGAGPEFVSSGPTISIPRAPDRALSVMRRIGIEVDQHLEHIIRSSPAKPLQQTEVEVVADGRTAAHGVVSAAGSSTTARVLPGWLDGDYLRSLENFIEHSELGVTVAAGEPSVPTENGGRGGRNTHSALTASTMISGTDTWFAALATDGIDGNSRSAGAIVDGTTVERGGDPSQALAAFDSAAYLEQTGDLIEKGHTGTNVADLWLIWKPESILKV